MSGPAPFVTVLVPCRQERRHIAAMLRSLLNTAYPRERLEILVVDGLSTDGTREVVAELAQQHPEIKLLDNPRRTTPAALNLGLAAAKGEIIVRADAHSTYPPDYISLVVHWLQKSGADNVGGRWRILPGADTPLAKAIALALAHPFGVGNAYYRVGAAHPRLVDTVPFGCYRREVFRRLGGFDEEQIRTEDDEFNLRLRKHGGRILLVPEIVIDYYARERLSQIWRTYFYYGYSKPLVARKWGFSALGWRSFVPSLLVASLLAAPVLGLLWPGFWRLGLLTLGLYLAAAAGFALQAGWRSGPGVTGCLLLAFPALHFSYGLGFLKGLLDFFLLGKRSRRDASSLPLAR